MFIYRGLTILLLLTKLLIYKGFCLVFLVLHSKNNKKTATAQ